MTDSTARSIEDIDESSFYRILKAANQLKNRGNINISAKTNQVRHFIAIQSNCVWSWDITYVTGSGTSTSRFRDSEFVKVLERVTSKKQKDT